MKKGNSTLNLMVREDIAENKDKGSQGVSHVNISEKSALGRRGQERA